VAEELGQARLVLTLDDGPLRKGLQDAKRLIEQELGGATASTAPRRAAGSSRRGGTSTGGGGQDFNELNEVARRFNLRSAIRALEELNNEFQQIQAGRQLNIGTSWGVALNTLTEISNDLQRLSAGSQLNLNASWTAALNQLSEIDTDLRLVAAGKELNLNSSWNAALNELTEIQADLTQVAAGEKLNLNSSWNAALNQLSEIDADLRLVSAAEDLNLRSAWTAALRQLEEIDSDLKFIAESKQFNIKSNWQKALAELNDIADAIKRSDLQDEIKEGLRVGQLNTSPVRGGIGFPGSPIAVEKAAEAERKRTRELQRARQALERQTAAERRQRQQQEKAGRERLTGALSNAIIGGAFPLLFGQGVGAAAGGGLGGAAGGLLGGQFGFGLSLVGTALGTAFDTALQKAQSLAEGLENPIKNFDALKEAALLSSRGLEKQVEALIEAGRSGEAYALIQADLAASFDDASAAKEYRDAVDNLNREWSRATTTLATFVAGPLAEFLENLRVSAGGKPQDAKEQQLQRDQQQALAKTFTFVGTLTSVLGGAVALTPAAPAGIATVGVGATLTGIGRGISDAAAAKEAAALSEDLVALAAKAEASFQRIQAARQRDFEIQRLGNKAVIENIRGNEQLASSDQKRRIELEKIRALEQATPEAREAVEADFNQQLAVLEENRIKNQRDLNVEIFKEVQTRNAIQRSIESTEQLLGTQRGAYRDTLRTVQQIQESIAKAREEETRIGFEIDQARLAGREQEASRLVDQQRTAALQTRAALVEGAQALKEAAETARDNFRDAVLNLTKIRSDPGGLNRFLTPGRQRLRAEQDTAALLPLFRQAQQQFFELTGQRAPEFRGPRTGVNDAIRDFIEVVKTEREANLAVQNAKAAADLIKTNQDLLEANRQLAVATTELAQKQWLVDVNVVNQAGGASTVNAVTSLAS
jgi:hypothetical protein